MAKKNNQNGFGGKTNKGVITVFDGSRVILEGVECIVFCDSEKMKIKSKGVFEIIGSDLSLQELGNDNIAVTGKISSILFGA